MSLSLGRFRAYWRRWDGGICVHRKGETDFESALFCRLLVDGCKFLAFPLLEAGVGLEGPGCLEFDA